MGEWREVALEDVSDELTVGYVGPMASQYVEEGVPFLRSLNVDPLRINKNDLKFITPEFHGRIRKSRLSPGDVVIVRTGQPGACSVVPDWLADANCSDLVIVRCGPQLDNRFLAYYVNTVARDHVSAHLVGAVQQHFNVGSARTLRLLLPPLPEQRAIAHILGTLDDKIELNRRMCETLEAMARALFKSWFVDFDPVRMKAAGASDDALAKAGFPKPLADLFPDSFEDSELGEIPKGWRLDPVGDHLLNYDSRRIPLSSRQRAERNGLFPYHGAAGVMDYVDDYIFDGIHLLVGEDGSVVTKSGTAVTQYAWGRFWVNNHAHVLQGKGSVSTEHLLLYFQSENIAPFITGAVQPKLSQGRMNTMPFLFAGVPVCRAFAAAIESWFSVWRKRIAEARTLSAIRDALLPQLLSGNLRVGDKESLRKETAQ